MDTRKHGMLRFTVYNRLRDDILNQVYKKGEALTESKITKDLEVSRTPVREAFVQLSLDGLVDATPNKGVIVRGLDMIDIQDMYDIRAHIEGIATKRACENITPEKLAKLQAAIDKEIELTKQKDFQGFQLIDYEFHDTIVKSSNSKIFENMLMTMIQYTRIARVRALSMEGRAKQSIREHQAIYRAIKNRDPAEAKRQMEKHIRNAKESFIKTLLKKENDENA